MIYQIPNENVTRAPFSFLVDVVWISDLDDPDQRLIWIPPDPTVKGRLTRRLTQISLLLVGARAEQLLKRVVYRR